MPTKSMLTGIVTVLGLFAAVGPQQSYALTYVSMLPEPGARSYSSHFPPRTTHQPRPGSSYTSIRSTPLPVQRVPQSFSSRQQYRDHLTRELAPYRVNRTDALSKIHQTLKPYQVQRPHTPQPRTVSTARTTGHGQVGHVNGGIIRNH